MLVLVLISIVVTFISIKISISIRIIIGISIRIVSQVLFVCCTTPAAVLSIMYSVQLKDDLGFQVLNLNHLITIIIYVKWSCIPDTNTYIQKSNKLAVMSLNTGQT